MIVLSISIIILLSFTPYQRYYYYLILHLSSFSYTWHAVLQLILQLPLTRWQFRQWLQLICSIFLYNFFPQLTDSRLHTTCTSKHPNILHRLLNDSLHSKYCEWRSFQTTNIWHILLMIHLSHNPRFQNIQSILSNLHRKNSYLGILSKSCFYLRNIHRSIIRILQGWSMFYNFRYKQSKYCFE